MLKVMTRTCFFVVLLISLMTKVRGEQKDKRFYCDKPLGQVSTKLHRSFHDQNAWFKEVIVPFEVVEWSFDLLDQALRDDLEAVCESEKAANAPHFRWPVAACADDIITQIKHHIRQHCYVYYINTNMDTTDYLRENHAPNDMLPTSYQGYTFWSSDFHISPIADLKDLFVSLGMHIIDKSLSEHCHLKNTCAKDLRVINKHNAVDFGQCPNQLKRDFFRSYKDDALMRGVDAVLCNHGASLCEGYMAFNKSLVVIVSTRYEIGRNNPHKWKLWNENLKAIANHPRNVVAANNRYDAEYVKYFTGIKEVPVLPNYCAYTHASYSPSLSQILIGPGRGINNELYEELMRASLSSGIQMVRVRDLYDHFEYTDLVKHPAIVLIPYQVSIMSIFEYYRMGIPLFVPSTDLLALWQLKYRVMNERTWNGVFEVFKNRSDIPKHTSVNNPYDPNDEFDLQAIKHWIAYADFYQWPHIETFDSFEDLTGKLASEDLQEISKKMMVYNAQVKEKLFSDWQLLFHRMFHGLKPAAQEPRRQIPDFDQAMRAKYGISVDPLCHGEKHSINYD